MDRIGKPAVGQQKRELILSNCHNSVMRNESSACTMSDYQLEEYMALVGSKVDILGEHYVNRQVEWAEQQLRSRGIV